MLIRPERSQDIAAIRDLTEAAFLTAAHRSGTEAAIVEALRRAGQLSLSLVAVSGDEIAGHVAFSPVSIGGQDKGWFGLGPVSVAPDRQRQGIGSALIREGLRRLQARDAAGCVVLGDPAFYTRLGFAPTPALHLPGVPPEYFMALAFDGVVPEGQVAYAPAFEDAGR